MDGIDYDKLNLLNLESKDKEVGNITGVENVTINNSISSEKNINTFNTEEIEEKIMNLPSLSENLINKK